MIPALIDTIWDHGAVEVTAIGRFVMFSKSDRILAHERAWARRVIQQEVDHAAATAKLARQLGDRSAPPAAQVGVVLDEYRDQVHMATPEEMLIYIYTSERLALRVFDNLARQLELVGLRQAAEHYEWILKDEREHVSTGGQILRRLMQEDPSLRTVYRQTLRQHYRGTPYTLAHPDIAL